MTRELKCLRNSIRVKSMDLLIVGAGAVGATYGYLASRLGPAGGARVTYFIKPKHRADLANGIQLYWWRRGRKADSIHFDHFSMIDDPSELHTKKFDAVLITLPSDKFRAEGWLEKFIADFSVGSPDGRIWSLQPSASDQSYLAEKLGARVADFRVVRGRIPIMGYLAPMPGEPFEKPGYAFYIPPGAKAGWSSKNEAAAREAVTLFENGGLPSRLMDEKPTPGSLVPEALLRALVAGLEQSEWSFDRLLNGPNIHLVTGGMREMIAIGAKSARIGDASRKWWVRVASSPFGIKAAIGIVRKIVPFDFEAFMRVHFTKVEAQMHLTIEEQIEVAKRNGLPATNLVLLRGRKKTAQTEKRHDALIQS